MKEATIRVDEKASNLLQKVSGRQDRGTTEFKKLEGL